MSESPDRIRTGHPAARRSSPVLVALLAVLLGSTPAAAYWSGSGSASGSALTGTVAAPADVAVPATAAPDVPVGWTPGTGGVVPQGHFVTRHTGATTAAACGSGPAELVTGDECVDTAVPDGEYTYTVTAVYLTWTAPSAASAVVTVVNTPTLLGDARSYSVLAGTAVVNTGATTISGDLGVSPGTAITGFPPGIVGGEVHAGDIAAASARTGLATAYTELAGRPRDQELTGEIGGLTFTAGVYHATAALAVTGTVTLDAGDDSAAVFVFLTDAAFNTAAASTVNLVNGARADNVYWVVAGAAGTGANSFLAGTILAQGAITLGASTLLVGRALSLDAVTVGGSTIRFTDALPPTLTIDGGTGSATKDTTPTITGTSGAPPSSPVTVSIGGQTLSTSVSAGGAWSVTATAALVAGVYAVVAKVRDPAGNGATASQTLTIEVNPSTVVLGSAETYSVLGSAVVNTDATVLSGDLGVSPGASVTGFPPGTLAGTRHEGDPASAQARGDLLAAYGDASSRTPHTEVIGDLGGRTFHIGVHHASAALALTGTLTLDAEGNPGAVFIFQTDAAFTTAAASTVDLVNGARADNVFWVVTGASGTGANSSLVGTILSQGAITLGASTALVGRALSLDAVTMAGSTLSGVTPAPLARSGAPPAEVVEPAAPSEPAAAPGSDEPPSAPDEAGTPTTTTSVGDTERTSAQ